MRSLAFVLAFSSFSAFAACPNLAGNYSACRSTTGATSGSTDVVVTQSVKDGITTYSITSTDDETHERDTDQMIADGKTRTQTGTDPNMGEVSISLTYKCSDVKVIGTEVITIQGQEIANVTEEVQKKGNTLEIDMNGTVFGENYQDTLVCQ